jgi:hypothetical protein
VRFWQGLDKAILAMQKMGIIAELILYHGAETPPFEEVAI